MEDEFSTGGGGVDVFREAPKADALSLKSSNCFDEVLERAAKSIQPPDNHDIARPCKAQCF